MVNEFNSIFSSGAKYAQAEETQGNTNEYKVSYKNGKDGNTYTSLIRFVVNPRKSTSSIVTKYVTWLKNPLTGRKFPVDNPKSENAEYNPIDNAFWHYYNTKDAKILDVAKDCIKTSIQHASIIQIIDDPQKPELKGKFMIFRYGKKIQDMIDSENNGNAYSPGRDPFHPFTGRPFMLTCTSLGGNNNYDQSRFVDSSNPGLLYTAGQKDGNGNPVFYASTPETENIQEFLYNYMLANCPVLEDYEYKKWDSATEEKVNECLAAINTYIYGDDTQVQYGMPQQSPTLSGINAPAGQPLDVRSIMENQNIASAPSAPKMGGYPVPNPIQSQPTVNVSQAPVPNLNDLTPTAAQQPDTNQFGDLASLVSF